MGVVRRRRRDVRGIGDQEGKDIFIVGDREC
jgi:hypothetical protein